MVNEIDVPGILNTLSREWNQWTWKFNHVVEFRWEITLRWKTIDELLKQIKKPKIAMVTLRWAPDIGANIHASAVNMDAAEEATHFDLHDPDSLNKLKDFIKRNLEN